MTEEPAYEALFFNSPRQAVEAISKMLIAKDWATLARYYDLDGSDIDRKTLLSGGFFVRTKRPRLSHPAVSWRYKHPFSPGFEYSSNSGADEDGIVTVNLSIRISQGAGSPAQKGRDAFEMRQSERGLQVLPTTVSWSLGSPPPPPPPPLPTPSFMLKKSGK